MQMMNNQIAHDTTIEEKGGRILIANHFEGENFLQK